MFVYFVIKVLDVGVTAWRTTIIKGVLPQMTISVKYLLLQSAAPMYVPCIDHPNWRGITLDEYLLITTDQSFTGLYMNTCTWN